MLTRWLESRKEGLGATWRSTDYLEGRLPWMGHQGTPSLTHDPLSPFNWAGEIWNATAKGTFSARYDDGSFSVTGTMDSALMVEGSPGHMGFERNGVFAQ